MTTQAAGPGVHFSGAAPARNFNVDQVESCDHDDCYPIEPLLYSRPMRAKQAPIHTSQSVAAAVVWTAVCAIFLAFHLIAFPMKTAWGKQHIPVLLYESHVISKDQVDGINDMMGDAFIPTVGALEGAIRSHVKGDQPILFVSGPGNPAGLDMLKYQLYPLRTSFLNAPVSQAVKDKYACRVEWLSNVDVTLMCPDLIWTNKAMVAGTQ